MDVARPDIARRKKRQRVIYSMLAVVLLAGVTLGLSRLEPAVPTVEKSSIWTDTVKRGEMLRQVRGNGTLVPEQIQFVQSETDGRVERSLAVPARIVTSVCFAGSDRRDLIVTTADHAEQPDLRGCVLRTRVDVAGAPVFPARI